MASPTRGGADVAAVIFFLVAGFSAVLPFVLIALATDGQVPLWIVLGLLALASLLAGLGLMARTLNRLEAKVARLLASSAEPVTASPADEPDEPASEWERAWRAHDRLSSED